MKRCQKHPKYKILREPIADCDNCWILYNNKQVAKWVKETFSGARSNKKTVIYR